jgi:hypothetical protein
VLEHPTVSHAELEGLAHRTWDLAFHAAPFPVGWKVRWGRLQPTISGTVVLGMAVPSAKVILLDEAAHRGRTWRAMLETVIHELVHVVHPEAGHGSAFEETLRRVLEYVMPADVLAAVPLTPASPVTHPRPTPPLGRRWGPGGWYEQEGLDPDLEYRG